MNSGQVGSMRAALFIGRRYRGGPMGERGFLDAAAGQIKRKLDFSRSIIDPRSGDTAVLTAATGEIQERMSACGAHIRSYELAEKATVDAWKLYWELRNDLKIPSQRDLPAAFKNLDLCLTHALYLEAIREYLEKGGKSRGSYLVLSPEGEKPSNELGEDWRFSLSEAGAFVDSKILELYLDPNFEVQKRWVDVRPVPAEDTWFETIWNRYMKDEIIR